MSVLIGPLPDGWQEVPLGDVCQVVAGPSSSMIRPVETGGVPIEVAAPKHLQHGRIATPIHHGRSIRAGFHEALQFIRNKSDRQSRVGGEAHV